MAATRGLEKHGPNVTGLGHGTDHDVELVLTDFLEVYLEPHGYARSVSGKVLADRAHLGASRALRRRQAQAYERDIVAHIKRTVVAPDDHAQIPACTDRGAELDATNLPSRAQPRRRG